MTDTHATTLHNLTEMQRKAVEWNDGPLLVLAGPGSGKTRVLTCRVARLLEESLDERFRILALTFTNKAAHEMKTRIAALAPGGEERAEINTFHGFCAQLLRQHGVHLGIKPNFEIYSRTADRQAVLENALRHQSDYYERNDLRLLPRIDALKNLLVGPEQAPQYLLSKNGGASKAVERIAQAYQLYEEELHRSNALDFNSLIFRACQLLEHPAFARHYQTIYRYWLIDEFQDTNTSQYALLRLMAGDSFRQVFAVADDDQTIYEWNGANVRRLRNLVTDFGCDVIQLTENFRCPPRIVEVANRLIVYNVQRTPSRRVTEAAKSASQNSRPQIQCRVFPGDEEEVSGIAQEIAALNPQERKNTIVLARNRAMLETLKAAFSNLNVDTTLLGRRDDFASPQMRWMVTCLKQINRPLDRRNMAALNEMFCNFAGMRVEPEDLSSRSETNQVTLLAAWVDAVREEEPSTLPAVEAVARLASGKMRLFDAVNEIIAFFDERHTAHDDFKDDVSAWRRIEREIRQVRGSVALDQFLQEMELRSKEPAPASGAVSLATIHGAKGLEFDTVYLIGMAEDILPSWHSIQKENGNAAIEEERRGCFVAITRTKQHLILSRAESYNGRLRKPSRFLKEMDLLNLSSNDALRNGSQPTAPMTIV